MKKRILSIVFLTIFVTVILSCKKDKDKEEQSYSIKWTKYTTVDGLINNNIHSIACDSFGNIWVGTDKGASSFDGNKWTNYINFINNGQVLAIAIDTENKKWFGSFGGGVAMFDGKNWVYYQDNPNLSNTISSNYIRSIAIDSKGNKWIGTDDKGVFKFDGQTWVNYTIENGLADNHVYTIVVDAQGNKWFGTNGGVSKFDDSNWTTYKYSGDKTSGIAGNGVLNIAIDKQGNKWFATFGGLSKFDGNKWTTFDTETDWLRAGSPVLSTTVDLKGHAWFGSNGWGISEFDGAIWTTYKEVNKSSIDPVKAIAIDKNGNKWFCTNTGLLKLEN
jgi:ligand-binding sensor domain-containing protein